MHIAADVRAELRFFAFYLGNRTLAADVLPGGLDYSAIFAEASAFEQVFAIWANIIDVDEQGKVTNATQASRRAAQYIRSYTDSSYAVEPPFEDWETALPL